MEGGLSMSAWMTLWRLCHANTSMGTWRVAWPDGAGTLGQSALLVGMFDLIQDVINEASKADG